MGKVDDGNVAPVLHQQQLLARLLLDMLAR